MTSLRDFFCYFLDAHTDDASLVIEIAGRLCEGADQSSAAQALLDVESLFKIRHLDPTGRFDKLLTRVENPDIGDDAIQESDGIKEALRYLTVAGWAFGGGTNDRVVAMIQCSAEGPTVFAELIRAIVEPFVNPALRTRPSKAQKELSNSGSEGIVSSLKYIEALERDLEELQDAFRASRTEFHHKENSWEREKGSLLGEIKILQVRVKEDVDVLEGKLRQAMKETEMVYRQNREMSDQMESMIQVECINDTEELKSQLAELKLEHACLQINAEQTRKELIAGKRKLVEAMQSSQDVPDYRDMMEGFHEMLMGLMVPAFIESRIKKRSR